MMNREQIEEAQRVATLIIAFIRGDLTEKQQQELDEWIGASYDNMQLFERLTDEKNIEESKKWFEGIDQETARYNVDRRIKKKEQKKKIIYRATAITAIVVLTVIGIYASFIVREWGNPMLVIARSNKTAAPQGVFLITASGEKIKLGKQKRVISLGDGSSADENEQGLTYQQQQRSVENTLIVPAENQYEMRLADGTKVWLNAQSSLKYPSSFNSMTRSVTLRGEAFFEVAKDKDRPFIVTTDRSMVRVLATGFNVNAYPELSDERITLLNGSVEVKRQNDSIQLRPDEQVIIPRDGKLVKQTVQAENSRNWTKGLFVFHDASIETVMNEVSVWYGMKVKYLDRPTDLFSGTIQKNSTLKQVLHMLEISEGAHFNTSDSLIIVHP